MNINLEVNEINFILEVLGQLPTKSGAFPLMQKIAQQAQVQEAAKMVAVEVEPAAEVE